MILAALQLFSRSGSVVLGGKKPPHSSVAFGQIASVLSRSIGSFPVVPHRIKPRLSGKPLNYSRMLAWANRKIEDLTPCQGSLSYSERSVLSTAEAIRKEAVKRALGNVIDAEVVSEKKINPGKID